MRLTDIYNLILKEAKQIQKDSEPYEGLNEDIALDLSDDLYKYLISKL